MHVLTNDKDPQNMCVNAM